MNDSKRKSPAAESAPPAQTPEIFWDDSGMVTSYANVCNVQGTRKEMMLLFGANQGWQPEQSKITVRLNNRILMTPLAAKRLHALLEMGLKEYENRYGPLNL